MKIARMAIEAGVGHGGETPALSGGGDHVPPRSIGGGQHPLTGHPTRNWDQPVPQHHLSHLRWVGGEPGRIRAANSQ